MNASHNGGLSWKTLRKEKGKQIKRKKEKKLVFRMKAGSSSNVISHANMRTGEKGEPDLAKTRHDLRRGEGGKRSF